MVHEMTEKYKSWLVSLDSDNFTMYIKTWFAFLASVHELVLSEASEELKEELARQKGDGIYLREFRKTYLNAISLNPILRQSIGETFQKSREIVRNDYPEYYFVTYYKKIIKEKVYDKRNFSGAYCPCEVDFAIQTDGIFLGFLFGDRPKIYRETLKRPYVKIKIPITGSVDLDIIDDSNVFYRKVTEKIQAKIFKDGADDLPEDKKEKVGQLIQRVVSALREDETHGRLFRPWIPNVTDLIDLDARGWFYDFCYSLRNVMFHRVIDPFDPRWSYVIKMCFQGLRELLLENIKKIDSINAGVNEIIPLCEDDQDVARVQ